MIVTFGFCLYSIMNTHSEQLQKKESYTLYAHNRAYEKAKGIRRQHLIPAIVYGHGIQPLKISVSSKEFMRMFHHASTSHVITLETKEKQYPVLIHRIQRDPLNSEVAHIDFYHIAKGDKVSALIPLEIKGISLGVKDHGCTLVTHIREVEVEALPDELPSCIEIDISRLSNAGDEIAVKDLPIRKGVNFLTSKEITIVSLMAAKKEEVKTQEALPSVEEAPSKEKKQDTR